ncbi:MAG: helix-turn-helix domain-containing protein [Bacteroidetes bacterium]|nr:helix-turn-helix domain-containing protein [Bacteroidota bacterium]
MENNQFSEKNHSELIKIRKFFEALMKKRNLPVEVWLDNADVCNRLRISWRKLATLRKTKQIPYVKKGAKIYYHVRDVDNYPDSGERDKKDTP